MSAFVNRIVEEVNAHPHLTVFLAERIWGTPYIFRALSEQGQPCVWLELNAEDEGDEVAAGNKLAAALSRAFGTQVVGQGMPYDYVRCCFETAFRIVGAAHPHPFGGGGGAGVGGSAS